MNSLVNEFDNIYSELDEVYSKMLNNFKNIIINVFKSDPNIADANFEVIKSWAKKIGNKRPIFCKN